MLNACVDDVDAAYAVVSVGMNVALSLYVPSASVFVEYVALPAETATVLSTFVPLRNETDPAAAGVSRRSA